MKPDRPMLLTAAILGFLAVAFGAFGAHALKEKLEAAHHVETWKTAAHYHLIHAAALLAAALAGRAYRASACCWTAGCVLFSGSLYLLGVTGVRWLGAVTPFGGLLLMAGWLALLLPARKAG